MDEIKNQLVNTDPKLKVLFDHVGNLDLSILLKPPYCALMGVIIGQKIAYKRAKRLRSNMYERLGTNFCCDDVESLSDSELSLEIGLSKLQIERIRSVNRYLKTMGMNGRNYKFTRENIEDLANVKGVGRWTVTSTILTSFPNVDVIPSGDLFIANKIKKLYNLPNKPSPSEIESISKKWEPHRGLVTWYLWRFFV